MNKRAAEKPSWGRAASASAVTSVLTSLLFLSVPFVVCYFYAALHEFDGALFAPALAIARAPHPLSFALSLLPHWQWRVFAGYIAWVALQAALYVWFPGPKSDGAPTPAGHVLRYNINGWRTYLLSVGGYLAGAALGPWKLSVAADNAGPLMLSAQAFGFAMTLFAFAKAHFFPTHADDRKFTGILLYDMFMGVELNPRIGQLDFKLFHNGRPGITAWTIINISYAAAQYERHGVVTNSMLLVNFLQFLYVADFFWNEAWYLKTIDIALDHYGFLLAWGDSVWLPFMYTLQGHYLVYNPTVLPLVGVVSVLALGVSGYILFRLVNDQKDEFRKSGGTARIWGKPLTFIEAPYKTSNGKTHQSKLLTSGFWGWSRHPNYIGDLAGSLSYCLCCGFGGPLPYFYILFMTILLVHRAYRDADRLKGKYGKAWEEYCRVVPWIIFPYVF